MRRFYFLPTLVTSIIAIGALSAMNTAFAGSVRAVNGKVKIYSRTISAAPTISETDVSESKNTTTIVIRERFYYPFYTRKERLARAFGHRYPGFVKQYSGPKYPF